MEVPLFTIRATQSHDRYTMASNRLVQAYEIHQELAEALSRRLVAMNRAARPPLRRPDGKRTDVRANVENDRLREIDAWLVAAAEHLVDDRPILRAATKRPHVETIPRSDVFLRINAGNSLPR